MIAVIPPDLIRPAQAAVILGVATRTVRNWIWQGRLPAWRRGPNRLWVSAADVRAMTQRVATRDARESTRDARVMPGPDKIHPRG